MRLAMLLLVAPLLSIQSVVAAPVPATAAMGAVKIPFKMPIDGQATVALYTPQGRVVRILGQLLELKKGDYEVRWDGMDLWGNLVPASTELVVKVFTNPGLKAFYEFTVGHAGNPPWLTKPMGEGAAMRTGGWMGDHTPPVSALAFGDRIFFGCEVAEHGHALIATNLDGEKLWGRGGLSGWRGPTWLTTDGKAIYGVAEKNRLLYHIDPETCEAKRIHDTGKDPVQAMAAHDGKLYLVLKSHKAEQSPFANAVSDRLLDYDRCRPIAVKGGRPAEHVLSARERFATTFCDGRNPQTGIRPLVSQGVGYVLLKFTQPIPLGTMVLDRIAGVAKADAFILKQGVAFDPKKHEPGEGLELATIDLDPQWELFGTTDFARPLSFIAAPRAGLTADVLLLRLLPPAGETKDFRPDLAMCRILTHRFVAQDAAIEVLLPKTGLAKVETAPSAKSAAWHFRTEKPISEDLPVSVVLDLKKDVTLDGLCLLGCTNPMFAVDALKGRAPADAGDGDWEEVTTLAARRDKRNGWDTARAEHNETCVPFFREVTARALRLRFTMGYGGGKYGVAGNKDDPFRCSVAGVALLKLADKLDAGPSHFLQVRNGDTGELVREFGASDLDIAAMVFDSDGTLYALANKKLCRSKIEADKVAHTVLNDKDLKEPISIALSPDRIAVGDAERRAVVLFDRQGKPQLVVGDRGARKAGPWDPNVLERPSGVAIDAKGKLWVAERLYAPKRISRFSAAGKFEKELLGPAEYGGGGFLDPDLKSFYYRSMHFALDWEKGTSVLRNLNARLGTEETPTLETNSFVFTKVGRPICYKGRRYIVGDPGWQGSPGIVVCTLDDGAATWRPCAVLAKAYNSPFLLKKECWKAHWLGQDLTDRSFIWCDRNGDGKYQVEEVEVFDWREFGGDPFATVYWCNWLGPDLTFWGKSARLAPSRFTQQGVPIYEKAKIQPFDYRKLSPVCMATLRIGMRAKPGYEGSSIVLSDGSLAIEAQPYVVQPDLTLLGGPLDAKPSSFIPPIQGVVVDNPLHYVGTAATKSPVGEVAVLLGNGGRWFVLGGRDPILLGWFFTGKEGGWSTDLEPKRGIEVTHRSLGGECFFGHFVKAHNGNYYVVAGHTFHALSRIEGLDAYQAQQFPLKVTAESLAANEKIRPLLVAAESAAAQAAKAKRSHTFRPLAKRTTNFQLDGDLADWGGTKKMAAIDDKASLYFDGACDNDGLYLAYAGVSGLGNASEDVRFLFKTGFCFDFMYRQDGRNRSRDVVPGDRRIVFGRHKGKWVAVLYDYVDPAVPHEKWVEFASPLVTTRVARVVPLAEGDVKIAFRTEDSLTREVPKGMAAWTTEVFVKWSALGLDASKKFTLPCDFGILLPDSGGMGVARRAYWSHRGELTVSDLGVEAQLTPAAWGTVTVEP
ncbi:MAG TPA: hypothetical protein VNE39_16445 [Planctomycetota bacterium]|nr:hypothetical protein [Planctomycetota bacterium]